MTDTGSAIGGLLGLAVGVAVVHHVLDHSHHNHRRKKKRMPKGLTAWQRETWKEMN